MRTNAAVSDDRLKDFRDFSKDSTRDKLAALSTADLLDLLPDPTEHITYDEAPGWSRGDGRPSLASDDPAVMQAIGRCAASRVRGTFPAPRRLVEAAHPSKCDWCDYPQDELLKACSWAVWHSQLVTACVLEWKDEQGHRYARPGSRSGYQNPEWRRFWELPPKERERRIAQATGRPVTSLIERETD